MSILFDCIREKIERKAEKVKESWERKRKQGRGKKGESKKEKVRESESGRDKRIKGGSERGGEGEEKSEEKEGQDIKLSPSRKEKGCNAVKT